MDRVRTSESNNIITKELENTITDQHTHTREATLDYVIQENKSVIWRTEKWKSPKLNSKKKTE